MTAPIACHLRPTMGRFTGSVTAPGRTVAPAHCTRVIFVNFASYTTAWVRLVMRSTLSTSHATCMAKLMLCRQHACRKLRDVRLVRVPQKTHMDKKQCSTLPQRCKVTAVPIAKRNAAAPHAVPVDDCWLLHLPIVPNCHLS
jgi:hypothetical protein